MLDATALCYTLALAIGLLASLVATGVMQSLAHRVGFIDRPDGGRKNHKRPVALGGGLAVYAAMLAGVGVAYGFAKYQGIDILNAASLGGYDLPILRGLLVASTLTVLLGLLDDRFALRGRYKLLGQVGIAGYLIYCGLQITQVGAFGEVHQLGWVGVPITLVWILGTVNAINLIDGIDGLASSVGAVLCLTVAAITGLHGHFAEAVIVLALAGALLGFLRYNFAPASIYLGDTGSMLIGLVVGVLAVHTSNKAPAAVAMAVPFAVWSVPILDSAAAILRRKLTGRSLFAADRGHLHHSLLTRGWSVPQAAMFITLICATTCLAAVLSVMWQSELVAIGIVLAVVVFLICTKTFGHIEFSLMSNRVRESAATLSRSRAAAPVAKQRSVQLQGSREWQRLWAAMTEAADDYSLVKMKLSISIPRLHEVFYGAWESATRGAADPDNCWRVSHPIFVQGQKVGEVELLGSPDAARSAGRGQPAGGAAMAEQSTPSHMIQVLEFLEPIEEDVRHISEQISADQAHAVADRPSLIRVPALADPAAAPHDPAAAPHGPAALPQEPAAPPAAAP
ncbi:MAG: MraY family glycosyltransferase [Planctomycetota bacterium]